MHIGISLAEPRSGSLQELTADLQQAADDGFSSAWMADIFGLDALSALAYAGARVADIEVGTAVTPTYLRHPMALARQAVTTDIATGGRLALGIGLSHQVVIEGMLHLSFDKPARHIREYLAVLLPLLREGKVSFSGETLGADGEMSIRPVGALPVLLAAMAPRMLHLAGAVADGTVLWMTGPRTIAEHVMPRLTDAAAEAGRAAPGWCVSFRSASPTTRPRRGPGPPRCSPSTTRCRRTGRCSTWRAPAALRTSPSSGTKQQCVRRSMSSPRSG